MKAKRLSDTTARLRQVFLDRAGTEWDEDASFGGGWAQAASVMVFLFGCMVLIGWSLELEGLRRFFAQLVALKVNTALGFLLAGLSLWMFRSRPAAGLDKRWIHKRRVLAAAYAGAVIAVGVLTMTEELTGADLGIDHLVFSRIVSHDSVLQPGRMGFGAALSFVLIGVALLLMDLRRCRLLARTCVILAGLFALLALAGTSFGTWFLFGPNTGNQLAMPTAVAFLLLCVGSLIAQPRRKKE
ncbi:MAG: hypothetical protein HZA91_18960 [Verrucomicrobia bacterium]|nr:hypothetical protein [Verrucomicrobiota bacterium]